jgi:hypothetical protein
MIQGHSVRSALDTMGPRRGLRRPEPVISAELVDAVTEAVVLGGTGCQRAAAVQALVDHMVEAVAWWHGSTPDEEELASLRRLSQAAADHVELMTVRSL